MLNKKVENRLDSIEKTLSEIAKDLPSAGKNTNGCFCCDNCPQNNDRTKGRFCVAWVEIAEKNTDTGQIRVRKQCGIPYLFEMLFENSKAADRVTENLTAFPKRLREEFKKKINGPESH